MSARRITREDFREYIESASVPEPNTGCWLWDRGFNSFGYGRLSHPYAPYRAAHRLSFWAHGGDPQPGLHVCHRCDTKACVNPAHLYLGTPKENTQDAIRSGLRKPPLGTAANK